MVVSSSWRILARARARVQPSRLQRPVFGLVRATVITPRERGEGDAGEDRQPAERLLWPDRVLERDHSRKRADERLEVDERACELRGDARLGPREQPERRQRAGQAEPDDRSDRAGRRRRRRSPFGDRRHRQRRERSGAELHGRHRAGVAPREQPRLKHDQRRGAGDRREHQQVARERRAGAAAAGDEPDAGDGDERAGPRGGARRPASERGGDHRHQHGHRADDERGVADASALDPGVLEQDHRAVAERARGRHAGRERGAQPAASENGEQRRREAEPGDGEPARAEPLQAELRHRHREAPEGAGRGESEERAAAAGRDRARERHGHIVGRIGRNSSSI